MASPDLPSPQSAPLKTALTPPGVGWTLALALMALGFLAMFLPTYRDLSVTAWSRDDNGHGPIVLALSFWLLWRDRVAVLGSGGAPAPVAALLCLLPGLLMYVVGRSQGINTLEALAQIPVLMSALLMVRGWRGLRKAWFPVFFLVFMVPLPGVVTQVLTLPLKAAVSYLVEVILYHLGYPIGRTGVTLVIGPYQLLVADACSGLSSIFTLEALGLFYMKLMAYESKARNVLLAVMIIPISFISNVTRVITLVLVTFYFGDEVGQGFLHSFAGMILFVVALTLTYGLDTLLAARFDKTRAPPPPRTGATL